MDVVNLFIAMDVYRSQVAGGESSVVSLLIKRLLVFLTSMYRGCKYRSIITMLAKINEK